LKIPYRRFAATAAVLALAGGGTALADPGNGNGQGQAHRHVGVTGPSGPTGVTGPQGPEHGKGKGKGKGKGRRHKVTYIFRGTWNAADGSVTVTGGNAHVRKGGFIGQNVQFDLTKARIVVADTDGDGSRTLADVKDGDHVLVGARLPHHSPGSQPFVAHKLIDQTNASAKGQRAPQQD
jgi:hypothetical protein